MPAPQFVSFSMLLKRQKEVFRWLEEGYNIYIVHRRVTVGMLIPVPAMVVNMPDVTPEPSVPTWGEFQKEMKITFGSSYNEQKALAAYRQKYPGA